MKNYDYLEQEKKTIRFHDWLLSKNREILWNKFFILKASETCFFFFL